MNITRKNIPTSGGKIFLGDTFRISLVVEEDGEPKDLTDSSVDFAVAEYFGGDVVYERTDNDPDIVVTKPQDGEIVMTVDTEEFENVTIREHRTYDYRIRVSDINNNFVTVAVGKITIYDNK